MALISPSILSANFANLERDINKVVSGGADWLHIDVMDGHFVPNLTIGIPVIKSIKKITSTPLDVHLMITNAENYIKDYIEAGADILTVHQEGCVHIQRAVTEIRSMGIKSGVALNPGTPIETLEHVLPDIDMILVMTVNPGFGGQKFIPQMINKISKLRNMIDNSGFDIKIQVDGGITPSNSKLVIEAGADIIVAGSAVFNSEDIPQVINLIKFPKG